MIAIVTVASVLLIATPFPSLRKAIAASQHGRLAVNAPSVCVHELRQNSATRRGNCGSRDKERGSSSRVARRGQPFACDRERDVGWITGLEPAASGATVRRSNH